MSLMECCPFLEVLWSAKFRFAVFISFSSLIIGGVLVLSLGNVFGCFTFTYPSSICSWGRHRRFLHQTSLILLNSQGISLFQACPVSADVIPCILLSAPLFLPPWTVPSIIVLGRLDQCLVYLLVCSMALFVISSRSRLYYRPLQYSVHLFGNSFVVV